MEFTNVEYSEEGDYTYDIDGYVQTSYINITAGKVDDYVNNAEYINLNAGATAETPSDPMEAGDHGFNYKCHIDISGMYELDFNLPNFLSVPGVNLTLFKKMNEFSQQVADLNANMIQFIQNTGCCDVSYEYNKTVVPIFRYLADHPDTVGCNTDNPKVLPTDTCAYGDAGGGNDNFMSEILKAITEITKVYTAIEPIFCIIKPIPGNPWMPMDFNWIRPILPYIEKFGKFAEKIMSGELIDVIIDPVKDINRNLFNCSQGNKKKGVDKTISSTAIINSINEIENAQDFDQALIEFNTREGEAQSSALDTLNKYSDKDLTKEFKSISALVEVNAEAKAKKKKLLEGFQTELDLVSKELNLTTKEQNKVNAYMKSEKNKPLQCLREILTLRPDLPKIPWVSISLLPAENQKTILRNDLAQVINEKAYDITYEDIYGDTSDFSNTKVRKEKIRFDRNTVYSPDFIRKFTDYAENDGDAKSYKKINGSLDWIEYLDEDEVLTAESFDTTVEQELDFYGWNKSTLEGVMDTDYEQWDMDMSFSQDSGSPKTIIENNQKIADEILKIQEEEARTVALINKDQEEDKRNWNASRARAHSLLKSIKKAYKDKLNRETDGIVDAIVDPIVDFWTGVTDYTVEQAELIFWNVFGNYQAIDLIKDPFDETNTDGYSEIINPNEYLGNLQKIVNDYIIKRKNLLGDIAKKGFNNDVENLADKMTKIKEDMLTLGTLYSTNFQLIKEEEIAAAAPAPVEFVSFYPSTQFGDTVYITYSNINDQVKAIIEADETYIETIDRVANNSLYQPVDKQVSLIWDVLLPGIYWNSAFPETMLTNDVQQIIDHYTEEVSLIFLPLDGATSAAPTIEGRLLRVFKMERVKKEYFETIDDNVAYNFYIVFNPELTLGCNIICELIQFVVNYLLAIIKKLLMMLVFWLIDYLVPDWLKNLIRLILYKLKCFLMMAYNVSDDEDKNRLLKIDKTYDRFMEAIRNRVDLYPYDACAKTALENATAEAALENTDTTDATNPNIQDAAVAHELEVYFANADLSKAQTISRYNYTDVKIVLKKDSLGTISNLVVKDFEDTLTGASATDLSAVINAYDPTAEVVITDHWYITTASNGDLIINNLDLSSLTTPTSMVSADSYKSTADVTDKYDSNVVNNRYSTLNVGSGVIQLQDDLAEDFLTFREPNKTRLKIFFKKDKEADIISITLSDTTELVHPQAATLESEEILGSTPLPNALITLSEYTVHYDSNLNLNYIIYDCTNFFPAGYNITGTLITMFEGVTSSFTDSILCKIDDVSALGAAIVPEDVPSVNDTFVGSTPVSNPGVNPDPQTAAELAEAGTSQARAETPVIFDCINSNGTITELLTANYESWIALGLIPDPTL